MEVKEAKPPSGYGKPPWEFKGSALYQLHLVKSETARAFIPKEFKLVEAFGYTLGGFFLASYDDSPAGIFDELVVIAGIVWNPPTSCAWAARVLVNSDEACAHGRKVGSSLMDVGLPSQVARFSKQRITPIARQSENNSNRFFRMIGVSTVLSHPKNCLDIQVTEINGTSATDICTINVGTAALAKAVPELNSNKLIGPVIKMSLPSFSGRTEYNPHLLKYSCQIECRIRAVRPAKVSVSSVAPKSATEQSLETPSSKFVDSIISRDLVQNERNLSISVLLSKPILALEFNCLKMQVEAPAIVCPCSEYTFRAV
ncbi:protein NEOXANTHIN-DEFICIENT 1 isoform X1 [Rhododendron vialii]|uniref:protein NEOXANTHIN-DEFICIENT 1 isoform X1 n=1 Tax=Rhododendron vialii TaxID=182163 RepID=UPI0026605B93|nr:protein NEOXANTHIN-DEFICIENT 1 isoform X1 [Rhododendron vialii]XP_058192758.1 protein NEOXANTHIN-DEFICIENT 1 isoform X1 [Rhododendron vialii]